MAMKKVQEDTPEVEQAKTLPASEKVFEITETAAQQLLSNIAKLPWEQANPLILFIQQSFKPTN